MIIKKFFFFMQVKYNIKGRPTTAENKTIEKNTTFTTLLNGLAGFEDYEVRINARTKSGESKFTDPVTVRTLQGGIKSCLFYL